MPHEGLTGVSRERRRRRWSGRVAVTLAAALTVFGLAACNSDDSEGAGKEIVITCMTCQDSPTDPALHYYYEATQRFNEKYKGQYHVKIVQNQNAASSNERVQYYQRLALAGDLPDIFAVAPTEVAQLEKTNALLDFAPLLDADPDWKSSFYDDAFGSMSGDDGQEWAIPAQRDAIGIFYSRKIFDEAGVSEFPKTWDELSDTCDAIKAIGKTCFAMDGGWITWLMWANLIGTQPGGADFLAGGIRDGDYANNPVVVKATEYLRDMHTAGYVNEDSVGGDFNTVDNLFVTGQAAMIANGPWEVASSIKGPNAPADLYDSVDYAPSPGWTEDGQGLIVLSGEGGLASGSTDPDKMEAVTAFVKFVTSRDEAVKRTEATSTFPPVKVDFTEAEQKKVEPLAYNLLQEADSVPFTYRHMPFAAPAGFAPAWLNLWPSYVQGDMSTEDFLNQLSSDALAGN